MVFAVATVNKPHIRFEPFLNPPPVSRGGGFRFGKISNVVKGLKCDLLLRYPKKNVVKYMSIFLDS